MNQVRSYRKCIVEHLTDLASEEYQYHEWVENLPHSWYSPDEIMCRWFDDARLSERNISLVGPKLLTADELEVLKPVTGALELFYAQYKTTITPAELLHFPPWVEVRETAQRALEKLKEMGWNTSGHYMPNYAGFVLDNEEPEKIITTPCLVCGYILNDYPWDGDSPSYDICPSCGIQFGYTDMAGGDKEKRRELYKTWRERWIAGGMTWSSVGNLPPSNWDPKKQLENIGVHLKPGV